MLNRMERDLKKLVNPGGALLMMVEARRTWVLAQRKLAALARLL